jgi:hypothetical protein
MLVDVSTMFPSVTPSVWVRMAISRQQSSKRRIVGR